MDYNELKDLDGQPILLHSRGGGTDSIANVIEEREGIKLGERSYVPGSANRVVALLAGQADATILDLSNKNKIIAEAGDRFHSLPMFNVKASDEALFANLDWIKANEGDVDIFVKALASVWQDMVKDPTIISRETDPDSPIGQLPAEILAELDGFYTDAVAGGLYDPNGGGREAAQADLEWYTGAGQLEGDPATLNAEDFWYFAPWMQRPSKTHPNDAACLLAGSVFLTLTPVWNGYMKNRPLLLKLLSATIVFGAWEIAGRIPISYAFPTFIESMTALFPNDF